MAVDVGASPQRRAKLLRPLTIGILILGLGGSYLFRASQKRIPDGIIVASGSLESDETAVSSKVPGRIQVLTVDEGAEVHQGELVAHLDDSELKAQLGQAEAGLRAAQAKLDEAIHGNRPEQIAQAEASLAAAKSTAYGAAKVLATNQRNLLTVLDLRSQLDAAEAKLPAAQAAYQQALAALKLMREGTRPKQIDEAKAAREQASVNLEKTEVDLKRIQTLADQGAIAVQNFDNARSNREVARKALDQADSKLRDLQLGPRPAEIRGAEMAVAQAKSNWDGARTSLSNAKKMYQDRLSAQAQVESQSAIVGSSEAQVANAQAQLNLLRAGSRSEDIASLRAQRDQAEQSVEYAKTMLHNADIFAPTNGVIKSKDSLVGETVGVGSPIVTVADLDHVWIRVYVPEDKYGQLKVGQSVDVKVDSFPGQSFSGRIVSIATQAEFTPKNAQTPEERVKLVFGVKITITNPDRKLKPGMPGDAWIKVR